MKIAIVLDDALARPDGVQQYVRAVAAHFGTAGHDVHVLCSGEAGEPPLGVTAVHSLTRNVGVTFNGNALRSPLPASRSRLRALLDRERFDVIHVMSPHSPVFAGRVVEIARSLQARSVRIVGTFMILPDGGTSDVGIRVLGRALRRNLRKFDAFSGLSGPAAVLATEAFGMPAEPTPGPVDIAALRAQATRKPWPETGEGRTVVTFLGRLVERKGVLELIAALAAMPVHLRQESTVRIGGRGPLLERAREEVTRLGLGEWISFDGFIADEDKGGYLAAADVAVFPATGGESFGIVLVEAMAAGAGCVLAGDNPGYAWTLGDPQAVVDPRDTPAFAAALERLIADPAARATLHARQQARVRDFDVAVVGAQLERLYAMD